MALGIGFGVNWGSISLGPGNGGTPIDERFIFTVKTDNAGTSASDQFTIPTSTAGITQAFLYDIETSDGQSITGLTGNHTITFPSAGTYEVRISGSFPYMLFNNGGDRLKMLDISNFGTYAQGSTNQLSAFYGCSNMVISATDVGNFGSVTIFVAAWRGCSSLTSFPLIDTSSGTNFSSTWRGCSSLTSFPLIDTSSGTNFSSTWFGCLSLTSFPLIDTSSVTSFGSAWNGCLSLTSFPQINTSSGTTFNSTFANCSSLTSFPLLDTSSGTSFGSAWSGCTSLATFPDNAFDTNVATNYTNAFLATNLTTQSIDDILVSLDTSGVSNGTFTQSGGQAPSATGEAAIDSLAGKGWTITVTGGYTGLGPELVTNGTFDTNTNWTFSNPSGSFGWQITGGRAICDGNALTPNRNIGQSLTGGGLDTLKTYRLSVDILQSADNILVLLGGATQITLPTGTNLGYTVDFTPTSTSSSLQLFASTNDLQEIDNLSIREVL